MGKTKQQELKKPLALQLWSIRREAEKDLASTFRQVSEAGYAGVETAGLYGYKPAEFRRILDDVGLVVCAAHVPVPTRETINEVIETAAALGNKNIISMAGPEQFKTMDSTRAVVKDFQMAQDMVRQRGLNFGYHNHSWEFDAVEGRLPMDILLEELPHSFLELDIYWASNFMQVDVPAFARRYANRMKMMHVKDGALVRGEPNNVALGTGRMEIAPAVAAADPNVLEWLVVEFDECATDIMQAVR